MKKENLLLSMNLIDDEYIQEADPKNTKKPFNRRKFATVAACFAVLLTAVGVWMLFPDILAPDPLAAYADSEYYPIIQKLNAYYESHKDYTNGGDITMAATMVPTVDYGTADTPSGGSTYEEITDNQVEGVIEGDLIKRSDRYIYYLNGITLKIYSIDGENSKKLGSYTLAQPEANLDQVEFYLSEDCQTVTLIVPGYSRENGSYFTQIVSLNVSNPERIVQKRCVTLNCSYNTSRKVDGELLLLGQYSIKATPDYSDASTFIPQITTKDGTVSVPMEGIIAPKELDTTNYTVICKLDENTLELKGSAAFLSYSNEVYVSQQNIFATRRYTDQVTKRDITTSSAMTEIAGISYAEDSLTPLGSVSIAGSVKDQYSLDEHNGILRAVTTTSVSESETYTIDGNEMIKFSPAKTSASLYCIDLSTWKVVAKVENFAPEGEAVKSVRFDGDAAYVCTAVVVTLIDPVFFFDLSDLDNITYTDTGTIEGYSTSLISFGDGYLVGIGVGDTRDSVKLEVYRESEDGVVSVCAYQVDNAWYSSDYKSYLIDRENHLIGLGIFEMNYEPRINNYFLFSYHEGKLTLVNKTRIQGDSYHLKFVRSVYIDGYLYVFSGEQFEVTPVDLTVTAQ